MTENQGIVWLASYPKSGNTWFRIFLTHILARNKLDPAGDDMEQAIVGFGSAGRFLMDRALGFDSRLLDDAEIARLRPQIYDWHAQQPGVKYYKIHDAYYTENQIPIVPKNSTIGIIYFIRNPLDVVISFAHHMNCSIDQAINMMNSPILALKGFAANPMGQVRQVCSTWSHHVKSWTTIKDIKLLIMRYEDMHSATLLTFSKALQFLQLEASKETIWHAIEQSQYEKLKQDEQKHGFKECAALDRPFFRKGIVGDWINTLTDAQIKTIISHHGVMMRVFGYLDENNSPVKEIDSEYAYS